MFSKKKFTISVMDKKEKIELTKKLALVISVLKFITLFTNQINLKKRSNHQKKEIKELVLNIERMLDKMP